MDKLQKIEARLEIAITMLDFVNNVRAAIGLPKQARMGGSYDYQQHPLETAITTTNEVWVYGEDKSDVEKAFSKLERLGYQFRKPHGNAVSKDKNQHWAFYVTLHGSPK